VRPGELVGELTQPVGRGRPAGLCPRATQPALDGRAVTLGQVLEHIAFFMANTPLDRGASPEDVLDGLPERLGTVKDRQDALLGVQAPVDEIGQQRGRDRGVLR